MKRIFTCNWVTVYLIILVFPIQNHLNGQDIVPQSPIEFLETPSIKDGQLRFHCSANTTEDSLGYNITDISDLVLNGTLKNNKNNILKTFSIQQTNEGVGKYAFIAKPDLQKLLTGSSWTTAEYYISYNLKGIGRETRRFLLYRKIKNTTSLGELYVSGGLRKKDTDDMITISIKSKDNDVRIAQNSLQVFSSSSSSDSDYVATNSAPVLLNRNEYKTISLTIQNGFVFRNNNNYNVRISSRLAGEEYVSYKKDHTMNIYSAFKVQGNISPIAIGNGKSEFEVTTSSNIEGVLTLAFLDNPLQGSTYPNIQGERISSNQSKFIINSDNPTFQYGEYDIQFIGKSTTGQLLEPNKFQFVKKKNELTNMSITQQSDSIIVNGGFFNEQPSGSTVYLNIAGTKYPMVASTKKEYQMLFKLGDAIINQVTSAVVNERIKIAIVFDGVDNPLFVDVGVKVVTKEDIEKKAEEITKDFSNKNKRIEAMKKYLS